MPELTEAVGTCYALVSSSSAALGQCQGHMESEARGRQEHPRTNMNLRSCEPGSSRLRVSGPYDMVQTSRNVHRPGEEATLIKRQVGSGGS